MENETLQDTARNKGQTLAEFAITLPILLLLLFGIVEFGRMFQSWVTLQNAARAAARYAVTGRYDEAKYSLDFVPCTVNVDTLTATELQLPLYTPDNFNVADFENAVGSAAFAQRYTYSGDTLYIKVPVFADNGAPNNEYLYRTWYGVKDCFPDDDTLQMRKDILRLPSIYDVARVGATGLSLEPSLTEPQGTETQEDAMVRFLYSAFQNPHPDTDSPGTFTVTVCSARARAFPEAYSDIVNNPDDPRSRDVRFYTAQFDPIYPMGGCIVKEKPKNIPDNVGLLDQHELPILDAGGAGQRITIMVSYNHPLITPLGFARYVRMQANRAAVNESFKVTNAELALGPGGLAGLAPVEPEPEATANVTNTFTPTPVTPSLTPVPTNTLPPTPKVFACENITLTPLAFVQNRLVVRFLNTNDDPTYLTGANIYWMDPTFYFTEPLTSGLSYMTFDNQLVWQGNDKVSSTDTRTAAQYPSPDNGNGVRFISPSSPFWLFPSPTGVENDPNVFEAHFNATKDLAAIYSTGWEFNGTEFFFDHPNQAQDCALRLQVPLPPPTQTPTPPGFVPTATFTPNCASSQIRVSFERFAANGDVVLRVVNNRAVVAPFRGFSLVWPAWRSPGLRFESINVSPSPSINASAGEGTVVWNSREAGGYRPASVVVGNPNPPTITTHTDTNAGTWNDGGDPYDVAYTIPANSTVYIHLNFSGVGTSSLETRGVVPSDFNGTRFIIECGRGNRNPDGTCSVTPCNGGPWGGGGGGGVGEIILDNQPTPQPTLPPAPTRTPGPTPTPSRTPSPAPPTNTFTPAPPTNTRQPTATLGATNTPTPTRTPGEGDGGPAD